MFCFAPAKVYNRQCGFFRATDNREVFACIRADTQWRLTVVHDLAKYQKRAVYRPIDITFFSCKFCACLFVTMTYACD